MGWRNTHHLVRRYFRLKFKAVKSEKPPGVLGGLIYINVMTTQELHDLIKEYPIENHAVKFKKLSINSATPTIGKRAIGVIIPSLEGEEIDWENLQKLKCPDCRIIDGVLIEVNPMSEKPYTIDTLGGTYLCHYLYEIEFTNKKVDDFVNNLRGDGKITYREILETLKNRGDGFLDRYLPTN